MGQVVGLAWTEVGGDLLTIEATTMPGKGNILRTGSLGDVMKESVEAARTVVRSRSRSLGIEDAMFENVTSTSTFLMGQHQRMGQVQVLPWLLPLCRR